MCSKIDNQREWFRLGANTFSDAVVDDTGIASLPSHEKRREGGDQVVKVAEAIRQLCTTERRDAIDGHIEVVLRCTRLVHQNRPTAVHRDGDRHVSDILRRGRAGGVRVHRVREGRVDDGHKRGRVRRHTGPDSVGRRSGIRRDRRPARPTAVVVSIVRRLRRQPSRGRVWPILRRPRHVDTVRAGCRRVLRQRRAHATGHHHRVRVLSHTQPGTGQLHHAVHHDRRVVGVVENLPAHHRFVRVVRQLCAVRSRCGVQYRFRLPARTRNERQNIQRDRIDVRCSGGTARNCKKIVRRRSNLTLLPPY